MNFKNIFRKFFWIAMVVIAVIELIIVLSLLFLLSLIVFSFLPHDPNIGDSLIIPIEDRVYYHDPYTDEMHFLPWNP